MALNFGGEFIPQQLSSIAKGQWNDDKAQTQIIEYGGIAGSSITHTVSSKKVFYLTQIYYYMTGSAQFEYVYLKRDGNVEIRFCIDTGDNNTHTWSFSPPIKYEAGEVVSLEGSDVDSPTINATMIGMEEGK